MANRLSARTLVPGREMGLNQGMDKDPRLTGPEGLGGWLLLAMACLAYLMLRAGAILAFLVVPNFTNGTYASLTNPDNPDHHPLWGPLLVYEAAGFIVLLGLAALALVFLLKKSRQAPTLVLAYYSAAVFVAISATWLGRMIPGVAAQPMPGFTIRELAIAIVPALVWIPYFLVSRRVRATFTHRWPRRAQASPPGHGN